MKRHAAILLATINLLAAPLAAQRPPAGDSKPLKPNFDALAATSTRRPLTPAESDALKKASKPGNQFHLDDRLGVPRFLWAADKGPSSQPGVIKNGKRSEDIAARG